MSLEKDKRFSKQFGDFAEHLVMYVLLLKNMRVARVDHVGADLIAACQNQKPKYAISVKGRNISDKESKERVFDWSNIEKLNDFANSFDLLPMVAFVITEKAKTGSLVVRVFFITLESLIAKSEDQSIKYITSVKNGYNFKFSSTAIGKNESYLKQIIEDKEIDFTELSFNSFNDSFTLF